MLKLDNYEENVSEALDVVLREVIDLSRSSRLFNNPCMPDAISGETKFGASYQIVGADRFAKEVAKGQSDEDSPIEQYRERLHRFESLWNMYNSYSLDSNEDGTADELIQLALPSCTHQSRLNEIAGRIFDNHSIGSFDKTSFENYLVMMADYHFTQICYVRALSLRRSFVITEMTFRAYSHGLIPFGWIDYPDSTLLCIES